MRTEHVNLVSKKKLERPCRQARVLGL